MGFATDEMRELLAFIPEYASIFPLTANEVRVPTVVICDWFGITARGEPDPPDKPVPATLLATRKVLLLISIERLSTTAFKAVPVLERPFPATTTSESTYCLLVPWDASVGKARLVILPLFMFKVPPTCNVFATDKPP